MPAITGIFGLMGNGKTMLMTRYAKKANDKNQLIYSNYHLKGIDYQAIKSLDDIQKMKNCIALFDELWLWLFARTSMANINKEIMKIVFLNRKRNVEIVYTAQLSRTIDILLREATQYWIYPYIYKNQESKTNHVAYFMFDRLGRSQTGLKPTILKQDLKYWGQYYDTTQEIATLEQNKKTTRLDTGKYYEVHAYKALDKIKKPHFVELLPNSGIGSHWKADIIYYFKKNCYAIDVKGRNKEHVFYNSKEWSKQIKNASDHANSIPLIIFPRWNKNNDKMYERLTLPQFWLVHELKDSYLKKNKADITFAKKLEKNSIRMDKYFD